MVVVDHVLLETALAKAPGGTELCYFVGGYGVALFFVLSGFIMVHTTEGRAGGLGAAGEFAMRRLVRIAPMYWLATLVAAILLISANTPPTTDLFWRSLVFLPAATTPGEMMRPVLLQGWTLNYEMFFYALFTLTLMLPRRAGLAAICGLLIALVAAGGLFRSPSDATPAHTLAQFYTDPVLLMFLAGVLVGAAYHAGAVRRLTSGPPAALAVVAIACGSVLAFALAGALAPPMAWRLFALITCVFTLLACLVLPDGSPGLGAALGDASYSTYLFHTFLIAGVNAAFGGGELAGWEAAICVIIVMIGGIVLHLCLEAPLTRRLTVAARAWATKPA